MPLKYNFDRKAMFTPALKRGYIVLSSVIFLLSVIYISTVLHFFDGRFSAYAALNKGNTAFNDGDLGEAEIWYNKALGDHPALEHARYNLGNAYLQEGRYNEAIATYEKALSLKTSSAVWNNLGNAYYRIGNLQKSADAYRHALLLDNEDAGTRQDFVFVSNKLAQQTEAMLEKMAKNTDQNNKNQHGDKDSGQKGEKQKSGDDPTKKSELSDKTINDLFSQINEHENKLRGKISKSKLNNDAKAAGLDY